MPSESKAPCQRQSEAVRIIATPALAVQYTLVPQAMTALSDPERWRNVSVLRAPPSDTSTAASSMRITLNFERSRTSSNSSVPDSGDSGGWPVSWAQTKPGAHSTARLNTPLCQKRRGLEVNNQLTDVRVSTPR